MPCEIFYPAGGISRIFIADRAPNPFPGIDSKTGPVAESVSLFG
jgi:hypothetical protein